MLTKDDCSIGMRVLDLDGKEGTVIWKGKVDKDATSYGNCTHIAVQFDRPTRMKNRTNGTLKGKKYCEGPEGTIEFRSPKEFRKAQNAEMIARLRAELGDSIANFPDGLLIKFLVARKYDFKASKEMLVKHVAWRKEKQPTDELYFPESMAEDYPVGYGDGVDKEGNLLYFERPGNGGKCHPKHFVEKNGLDVIGKWHIASVETGRKRMEASNYESPRVTMVIDLLNLGDCGTSMIKFARLLASIDQDNYPEQLARMIIINAPSFFQTVWRLVRLAIDDRTKDKIRLVGKDFKEALLELIDEEYLPTFCGGSNDSWLKNGGRSGLAQPNDAVKVEASGVVGSPMDTEDLAQLEREAAEKEAEEAAKAQKAPETEE